MPLESQTVSWAGRHRVIKWSRCVFGHLFGLPILHFERWLLHGLMTCSLLFADHVLGKVQGTVDKIISTCGVLNVCLAWLYELFVGMLTSLTNAYAGCGKPTLHFNERSDLGPSVPTAKPLHLVSVRVIFWAIEDVCESIEAAESWRN